MSCRTRLRPMVAWLALSAAVLLPCVVRAQGPAGAVEAYRVGPKDLIQIKVFEAPEFDTEARISEMGTVKLPVVGEIEVRGLTEEQLAARLVERLEECCVQRASVAVQVIEFRSRPISVIGAVNRPGPLSLSGRWTLLEAITAAGGLAPQHADEAVILRRAENGLSDQLTVRISDLFTTGAATANIPLFANDLVHIPAAAEVTVFCLGEVNSPGAFTFKSTERVTVLTAVAKAGGLTDRAASRILVKRQGRDGAREIEIDYKKIIAGKAPDAELQDGDVLLVKESFF